MTTRRGVRRPSFGDVTPPISLYLPVSFVVLGLVTFVALVILMIGARSPYTHANLNLGYDPRYERTEQILVGAPADFAGLSPDRRLAGADALEGRGGVVGTAIAGADEGTVAKRVRQGSVGMPRFSTTGLTDAEIADITAYLRSLGTK